MSKVYTAFSHKLSLPGACAKQVSYLSFESKQSFIQYLVSMFEDNQETISNLDGDDAGEDTEQVIEELNDLLIKDAVNNMKLNGRRFEAGSFSVEVYVVSTWPDALLDIKSAIENIEELDKYELEDLDELEEYSQTIEFYYKLNKLNPKTDEKLFDEVFEEISLELSQESVF